MRIVYFLFPFLRRSNLAGLEKQSADIMSVFTKTQQQCIAVNQSIAALTLKKEENIKALQSEVSTLNAISTKNAKLAGKIEAFIAE